MLSEGSLRQESAYHESINVNYQDRQNLSRMDKLGGRCGQIYWEGA